MHFFKFPKSNNYKFDFGGFSHSKPNMTLFIYFSKRNHTMLIGAWRHLCFAMKNKRQHSISNEGESANAVPH